MGLPSNSCPPKKRVSLCTAILDLGGASNLQRSDGMSFYLYIGGTVAVLALAGVAIRALSNRSRKTELSDHNAGLEAQTSLDVEEAQERAKSAAEAEAEAVETRKRQDGVTARLEASEALNGLVRDALSVRGDDSALSEGLGGEAREMGSDDFEG